jgi:hypothetical protein
MEKDAATIFREAWENIRSDVQDAWRSVLTPPMITKINVQGRTKLEWQCTLLAVTELKCDVFVSRYNSNPQANEDPIDKMIYGTKGFTIKAPVLLFLFDEIATPLRGKIDTSGQLMWF